MWDAEYGVQCFPGLSCFLMWSYSVEPGCPVQSFLLSVLTHLSELLRPVSICICKVGALILGAVLRKVLLGWSRPFENE